MKLKDAIGLIYHADFQSSGKTKWLDLGCGSGTFTLALAGILKAGSEIQAIDIDQSALSAIPDYYHQVSIFKKKADITKFPITDYPVDGVLMANSLHFIQNKPDFIKNLSGVFTENGVILLVEYDTDKPSHWVPYPLSFRAATKLFHELGCMKIQKLNTHPSIYGNREIYASLIYLRGNQVFLIYLPETKF